MTKTNKQPKENQQKYTQKCRLGMQKGCQETILQFRMDMAFSLGLCILRKMWKKCKRLLKKCGLREKNCGAVILYCREEKARG